MSQAALRPIPGFPSYVATKDGYIIRVRTQSGRPTFRVLRQYLHKNDGSGRLYVRLSEKCRVTKKYVHQLIAAAWLGPCPVGYEVDHKDSDRNNNDARNLEYVTPTENRRRYLESGESSRRIRRYLRSERYRATQRAQRANGWNTPRAEWSRKVA